MEFKSQEAEQKYQKIKKKNTTTGDKGGDSYMKYVFNMVEKVADRLEALIDQGHNTPGDVVAVHAEHVIMEEDDGMSGYQYDLMHALLRRYWLYGDTLKEEEGDE